MSTFSVDFLCAEALRLQIDAQLAALSIASSPASTPGTVASDEASASSQCFPSPPPFIHRPTPVHPSPTFRSCSEIFPPRPPEPPPDLLPLPTLPLPPPPPEPEDLPKCSQEGMSEWISQKLNRRSPGGGATTRMSYPREFKLGVIEYFHANGRNKYRTCKLFHITKSMLNGWLSKTDKIRESRPGSFKSGRSGRRSQHPDIDSKLRELYERELANGHHVSNRWLREQAKALTAPHSEMKNCEFSERWLSNFRRRCEEERGERGTVTSPSNSISGSAQSSGSIFANTDSDCDTDLSDVYGAVLDASSSDKRKLPIQVFYSKYPWFHRRCSTGTPTSIGKRGRKVQFPEVERLLNERLHEKLDAGHRVSNRWLQEEARVLARQLHPDLKQSSRCLFSDHWLHNFKKRYAINLKARQSIDGDDKATVAAQKSEDGNDSAGAAIISANECQPAGAAAWTLPPHNAEELTARGHLSEGSLSAAIDVNTAHFAQSDH